MGLIGEYADAAWTSYNCNFIMQDTNYSVGPKFFGTSTKSNTFGIKNRGLMKETAVLLVLALMTFRESIKLPLPLGQ